MRFTFDPLGDLEVSEGVTLAECRADLHRLTGTTPDIRLAVGDVILVGDQVAGVPPWVAGCTVEVARPRAAAAGGPPPARWQLVVVAGPDAGSTAVPDADGAVVIGRGSRREPGRLPLDDPHSSRWHAVVRGSGPAVRARWTVRDTGSANGTVRVRRGHRRQVRAGTRGWLGRGWLGRAWLGHGRLGRGVAQRGSLRVTRLRPGDRLAVGGTTVELRRTRTGVPADRTGVPPRLAPSDRDDPPSPAVPVVGWLLPTATSAVLALATRNPVYLLVALTGPTVVALPLLLRRLRRGRARQWRPSLGPDPVTTSQRLADGTDERPVWWPLAVEGLAVVGDRAEAVARALVGAALLSRDLDLAVLHPTTATERWTWCRWLEPRLGRAAGARVARSAEAADAALRSDAAVGLDTTRRPGAALLVVSDGVAEWRTALDRWWLRGRRADDGVVVLAADPADVPAWCRWVAADDRLSGPVGSWPTPTPSAGLAWAERYAREVAAMDATRPRARTARELPAVVSLADLLPGESEVLSAWAREDPPRRGAPPTLAVPLGVGPGGTVVVDLVADGPHALVAGTTGSGKSELVQSLVLGLALTYPPTDLAMVLLDFKGGAGLGRCRDLPHVVGQVDDLDPEGAQRALEGLRTELRRREAVLAAAGVADVTALGAPGGPTLPRLLVVVDEFRAMSEDLPDFVPGLVRLAAQGRSLGFHLVLATQRPGGAVSPQMRANLALRICLRVTEPADSVDVLEVTDAAALPQDRPGRALLRRGSGPVEELQAAWAGGEPAPHTPRVRWAPGWSELGPDGAGRTAGPTALTRPAGRDRVTHLVHAAVAAAQDRDRPAPIWSPPLPAVVRRSELRGHGEGPPVSGEPWRAPTSAGAEAPGLPAAPARLVLGLTDPPGSQGRGRLEWDGRGLVLAAGRRGSGRRTIAATVTDAALDAGWMVHRVARGTHPHDQLDPSPWPGLGTVVGTADPRRIARLLTLLLADPPEHRQVLVLDDLGAVTRALDLVPRGLGLDLLDRVLRERPDLGVLATGDPRDLARWTPLAALRLVLAVQDPADDVLLGIPRSGLLRSTPGRALAIRGDVVTLCQVAVSEGPGPEAAVPWASRVRPHRLAPLPATTPAGRSVSHPDHGAGRHAVLIGIGGDDASGVVADVSRGLLVIGPPGTGRSTALQTVGEALRDAGLAVATITRDGTLTSLAPGGWSADPTGAAALVRRCSPPDGPDALVVDDLDLLARTDPATDEVLTGWVHGEVGPVLVAAARTDRAAAVYRGACAALRGTAAILVLAPLEPGSQDVAGRDLALAADPNRPRHPGRGVLVQGGHLTPVQVALRSPRHHLGG